MLVYSSSNLFDIMPSKYFSFGGKLIKKWRFKMRSLLRQIMIAVLVLGGALYGADIAVTTKYGKTGGIIGPLNNTTDKVNGRTICPSDPTNGCDFSDDPGFNNNNTVDDSSDDYYTGDLLVRTNDNFQAIAAWNWNGNAGGDEEQVTITGTLPTTNGQAYYEWAAIPGSCDPQGSSISDDGQTIVCVRKDFDKNDAGTSAEDLIFNVRVRGGTPNGAQPGDITFKVEAPQATAVEDTTDGNSLTVTAAPRWNIDLSRHGTYAGEEFDIDGDGTPEKGWIIDYKFYIESDEVSGETDDVNPIVGNESMGSDATFTFTDDLSGMPAGSTLIGCGFTGGYDRPNQTPDGDSGDGYNAGNDPLSYYGPGSIYGNNYPERHILQLKNEQNLTCVQNGNSISITAKHIDATLDHYPTKAYNGDDLPVNRAIAALGNIYIFIPLESVKKGEDGQEGTNDDGEFTTRNKLTGFDPTTPSNNSNFGDETESEKDNDYALKLYYASGSWSKRFRGGGSVNYNGRDHLDYVYGWPGTGDRTGDGMVTSSAEFSTYLVTSNSGGTPFTEDTTCDVIDAYRLKIQPIKDNTVYHDISNRFTGNPDVPYRYYIWGDEGNYTDGVDHSGYNPDDIPIPYIVEYATTYVDDSFLPSKGGDTTVNHSAEIERECTDASVQWTTDFEEAMNGPIGITKVRFRLKPGVEVPSGGGIAIWVNHKIREQDLVTNASMNNNDLIVNYAGHKFNYNEWYWPTYIPGTYPGTHSGWGGDRVIYTGPKVRIKKAGNRDGASPGDSVIYTLSMSYTDDIGSKGNFGNVKIVDALPKDFNYVQGSTVSADPNDPFGDPVVGTCNDVEDTTVTCVDGENQVLIWDLGDREVNAPEIPDLNYTALIGAAARAGTNVNTAIIASPTDASPVSQRRSDVGLAIDIPSSISIVKSTVENPDYPSLRERTTEYKEINFVMDVRNGKDGNVTDVDVIDILPFEGDGEKVIHFNDILVNRKVPTGYHGSMRFKSVSFNQHPGSDSVCEYDAIKYYYTNKDPEEINMAPTVGSENDVNSNDSIWCEGDENGPNGCTVNGQTLQNDDVTAVRVQGAVMEEQAICQFHVNIEVKDNLAGDNYSNSSGASATGVTLPVLSNSPAVPIVGSSLGDYVWYDKNKDGIQDDNEAGLVGVKVHLLDASGNPVNDPTTGQPYVVETDADGKYRFSNLNSGSYQVKFEPPVGYIVSPKEAGGNTQTDSNVNSSNNTTDTIVLDPDTDDLSVDMGLYTPVISGNVFDDGDGNSNVNGSPVSAPDGTQLHATLLDTNGAVLATTPIAADGTYSFDGTDGVRANTNYRVVLSTTPSATSSDLPANWNNTGEKENNQGTGNDGTRDGIVAVSVGTTDVPNNDFGINKKPVAQDVTEPSQLNPGGNTQVAVPNLDVSDLEDGTPTTITIKTLPTNATLYYNGTPVTAGQAIPNFDPSKLTVDPEDGDQTVVFTYTTTDAANVESDPATVTLPFTGVTLSGHVFDDGNGDGNINGTPISKPDGIQLYATLLDKDGNVIASTPIATDGTYMFTGADGVTINTKYSIILATTKNATDSDLPLNWNNADGEQPHNTGSGNDGQVMGAGDGKMTLTTGDTTTNPNNDFGINHRPTAEDKSKSSQTNPGGTNRVPVPVLRGNDDESSTLVYTIRTLPSNATLYYNGIAITTPNFVVNDPALLTVDPDDGDQTVVFTYTTTDEAGVVSAPATVTMPFTVRAKISGKVSTVDNAGNYSPLPGVTLVLFDSNGNEVARTKTDNSGYYSFIASPGRYTIAEIQPESYYSVSENEGGADDDATNAVINTLSVVLGNSEHDIKNDFVEKKIDISSCMQCAPAICNTCAPSDATAITSDGATVRWRPTKNVTHYEVYVNGQLVATVNQDVTRHTLRNLESDKSYTIKVVAYGKKGGMVTQTISFKTKSAGPAAWLPAIYSIML
jgi:hypothetical protein